MLDVLTITLNPAIDQSVRIDDFEIDQVNRISKLQNDPGGKGINVAAYLAASNLKVGASGFLGEDNPSLFKSIFEKLNIKDSFVYISGATRTNVKVIDEKNKTVTDINQAGFTISKDDLEKLENELFSEKKAKWYLFSGSLPKGLGVDIYKRWIEKAHSLGIKVALDASGEALLSALDANPELVKPNQHELSEILNKELNSMDELIFESTNLINKGVKKVCISMGKDGALLLDKENSLHALPGKVNVKTTVGAGDAMISGLIYSDIKNLSLEQSLKISTAYSMSAVETVGPYLPSKDKLQQYQDDIKILNLKKLKD
jgi:1-phosphofructokinase